MANSLANVLQIAQQSFWKVWRKAPSFTLSAVRCWIMRAARRD